MLVGLFAEDPPTVFSSTFLFLPAAVLDPEAAFDVDPAPLAAATTALVVLFFGGGVGESSPTTTYSLVSPFGR